ncbi:MAG: YezD family protein [Proteobacteria bacterium]|nr:YezD family protein [Pseudomonadota bacterium]
MSNSTNPRSRLLDELLAEAIAGIRYGAVEITIHDGRIVQIEKREKLRPAEPSANGRNAG